jgi:hypothetical protein
MLADKAKKQRNIVMPMMASNIKFRSFAVFAFAVASLA